MKKIIVGFVLFALVSNVVPLVYNRYLRNQESAANCVTWTDERVPKSFWPSVEDRRLCAEEPGKAELY